MTKQVKRRKANIYRVLKCVTSETTGQIFTHATYFTNRTQAMLNQEKFGGVLTRWSYQEQIEVMPKKRGKK